MSLPSHPGRITKESILLLKWQLQSFQSIQIWLIVMNLEERIFSSEQWCNVVAGICHYWGDQLGKGAWLTQWCLKTTLQQPMYNWFGPFCEKFDIELLTTFHFQFIYNSVYNKLSISLLRRYHNKTSVYFHRYIRYEEKHIYNHDNKTKYQELENLNGPKMAMTILWNSKQSLSL